MPTLHRIIESTQRLRSSKWYFDVNHYAQSVGITTEEANGFFKCIRDGGMKKDESWQHNPAPFEGKIDLTCQSDNLLNIHVADFGNTGTIPTVFAQPSEGILSQSRRFVYVGKVSKRNKDITPKVQREIAQYIVGTHQILVRNYPAWAKFRQDNWQDWIRGGENSKAYQVVHLPWIATHFWNLWDAPVDRGAKPCTISPTVLDLVKNEIIDLLVRMFVLPSAELDNIVVRRSRRNSTVSDCKSNIEIEPVASKKRKYRQVDTDLLDPDGVDGDAVDASDPNASTLRLFNLGELKQRWQNHEYEEVGRREIALLNARGGKDGSYANKEFI